MKKRATHRAKIERAIWHDVELGQLSEASASAIIADTVADAFDAPSRGGRQTSAQTWGPSREFAERRAALLWAADPTLTIGAVTAALDADLCLNGLRSPGDRTLRDWLKAAHAAGRIVIPEGATKGGRRPAR